MRERSFCSLPSGPISCLTVLFPRPGEGRIEEVSVLELSACISKSGLTGERARRGRRRRANLTSPTGIATSFFHVFSRESYKKERLERRQRERGGEGGRERKRRSQAVAMIDPKEEHMGGSRPWQVGHMRLCGSSLPGLTPPGPVVKPFLDTRWGLTQLFPPPPSPDACRTVLMAERKGRDRTWEETLC